MELWVHYTIMDDGSRMYNMNILKTCHASILGGVMGFLTAVHGVLDWAMNEFVNEVADQLLLVKNAT